MHAGRAEGGAASYNPSMLVALLLSACALPTPAPPDVLMVDEALAACDAGSGEACMQVAAAYRELAVTPRAKDPEGCCLAPARDYEVKACEGGFEDGCREVVRHDPKPCPGGEAEAQENEALRRLCLDHEDAAACALPAEWAADPECHWSADGLPATLVPAVEAACEAGDARSCRQLALSQDDPGRQLALLSRACGVANPSALACAEASTLASAELKAEPGNTTALDLLQRACKLSPQEYCGPWAELALQRCEEGEAVACVRLAKALRDGDEAQARGLLEQSCEAGGEAACAELETW